MDVRSFFGKRPHKKATGSKVVTKAVGKKTFARLVRKAAKASHEEVKHASTTLENLTGHNSAIGPADPVAIMPRIVQGGDDFNRIGNRIYARGLYVKGRIGASVGVQANNRPISVRVMILSQRNVKDSTQIPSSISTASILSANDTSAGTSVVAYDGTTRNALYPVNKDFYMVHYKRDFLLTPDIDNNVVTPGTYGVEANQRSLRRWACKVRIPKSLMYFDSVSGVPQNSAPFLVIGYCYADGTAPDSITTRVTSSVVSTLYYTDA